MSSNKPGYRSPSYGFTKDELASFAVLGIRDRVLAIEKELQRIQRSFPDMLISAEPIVLLAAERRTDGKTWPLHAPDPARSAAAKHRWTPKRRKEAAARMRKKLLAGKHGAGPLWQEMRAVLQAAKNHTATSQELREALHLKPEINITSALADHPETFKRVEPGVYTLTAAGKAATNGADA